MQTQSRVALACQCLLVLVADVFKRDTKRARLLPCTEWGRIQHTRTHREIQLVHMTDTPKKKISTEAEDVFEFLDSLPQDKQENKQRGKDKGRNSNDSNNNTVSKDAKGKKGNDEDIFDFLEELENSKLNKSKESKKNHHIENIDEKTKEGESADGKEENEKDVKQQTISEEKPISKQDKDETISEDHDQTISEDKEQTPLNDPITSFSNWWSSSGQTTVANLWNKTTEQANQIKNRITEETNNSTALQNLNLPPINFNATNRITELAKNLQKIVVGETEEVLRIHLVHDLINYSYLQYHVHDKFDQVLSSQVQGGIRIFVDEWGKPSNKDNIPNNNNNTTKLNAFTGKIIDGEKLAFANLENSIKLFNQAHDEMLRQQKEAEAIANENTEKNEKQNNNNNNNNSISDIFISILPIVIPSKETDDDNDNTKTVDSNSAGNFNFTIILKDITNDITSITRSQGFPVKWIDWLEGSKLKQATKAENEENEKKEKKTSEDSEDEDDEIVDAGDWVQEWVEDGISLAFGVVAQNYVIERMGF